MPMTCYEDERCPFCRGFLTDLDGIYECFHCGAGESLHKDGSTTWNINRHGMEVIRNMDADQELYDSNGKLIGGDLYKYQKHDV